jgi:dTMP kinase
MPSQEIPDPNAPSQPGVFLVLDGPDGGGKTTQVANLAAWLRAQGREVVTCREPGGTPLGDRLRSILLDRGAVHLGIRAEMLLFMASRAQLVQEVIRPALEAGKVVVSDRFVLATIIYQGYASGLGVDDVGQVGLTATGGLFPDLTLILDVPTPTARSRVGRARDRIEDRPDDYHARVRVGFLRAADEARRGQCAYYPAPIVVVDASADLATVTEKIQSEVARVMALDPRG